MPSKVDLLKFHEKKYQGDWTVVTAGDKVRIAKLVELVGSGKKVLDLGCYEGTVGEKILKRGNRVWGVDICPEAVAKAKKRGVEAVVGNVEETFPFPPIFFDVTLAGEIIEHVVDTAKFLKEISRVTVAGGYLVISTPNLASLGRRILLFLGKNPMIDVSFDLAEAGHIRYYVKENLFKLLEAHGFTPETVVSDVVNFDLKGKLYSQWLARLFPTVGRTLIVKAKKVCTA